MEDHEQQRQKQRGDIQGHENRREQHDQHIDHTRNKEQAQEQVEVSVLHIALGAQAVVRLAHLQHAQRATAAPEHDGELLSM